MMGLEMLSSTDSPDLQVGVYKRDDPNVEGLQPLITEHLQQRLRVECLDEPRLLFKSGSGTYCKEGLINGPFSASTEGHRKQIIVGMVTPKHLADSARAWVQRLNESIESEKPRGSKPEVVLSKRLFPDFSGAPTAFETEIVLPKEYTQPIITAELVQLDRNNSFAYVDGLLLLFEEKIRRMIAENNTIKPHVVLCVIDEEMFEYGHAAGNYHAKRKKSTVDPNQINLFEDFDKLEELAYVPSEERFYTDFRCALKKRMMNHEIGVPVQILRQETLESNSPGSQNDATKAWNICAGLTYKAGNIPWVLEGFEQKTCYLGLSFYHKKDRYRDDVFTAMAHIYRNNYDGLVLEGDKAELVYDEETRSKRPYLSYEKARKLAENAVARFQGIRDDPPDRVVVHKTSVFEEDEVRGFSEVFEALKLQYDLVSVRKSTLRIIRHGDYPVARGTYWEKNKQVAYLYTKGYISDLDTYPGVHIPAPFQVIKARGDTSIKELCREILALTKLNWNTADFCSGLPITIGFASNVGRILREFDGNEGYGPESGYRFYM
jgi:hypothetical protein